MVWTPGPGRRQRSGGDEVGCVHRGQVVFAAGAWLPALLPELKLVYPGSKNILLLSPCSGHGFKFASVIGEIAADLLTEGTSSFDLSPFCVERLL